MLPLYQNFPFFSIFLCAIVGILCILCKNGRTAFRLNVLMLAGVLALNAGVLTATAAGQTSFVYWMGHVPAPWGNELRGGVLEALMAVCMTAVLLLSLLGGRRDLFEEVAPERQPLYFVMIALLMASLLALIYTNDIFTGYVFIEINTITACALVMAGDGGPALSATLRYLIMSVLGSGLFLLGLAFLYGLTGQLLMEPMQQALSALPAAGGTRLPLAVGCGLMVLGLAIKSALWPAHSWLPDAHSAATTASSAILSGLVLKGYIFFLIKLMVRVFTPALCRSLGLPEVLFVLGCLAMIMGSIGAARQQNAKRMIAWSSVAQVGYIFMGLGLGVQAGYLAALYQMLVHMAAKPLLFICAGALIAASGHQKKLFYLRGAALRCPLAGLGFTIGGLSMVGLPLLGGFAVKLALGEAALLLSWQLPVAMAVLGLSSVLNAYYYVQAIVLIWRPTEDSLPKPSAPPRLPVDSAAAMGLLAAAVVALGVAYEPVYRLLSSGFSLL